MSAFKIPPRPNLGGSGFGGSGFGGSNLGGSGFGSGFIDASFGISGLDSWSSSTEEVDGVLADLLRTWVR